MKSSRKRKVTAAFFAAAALGGVAHAAPTLNMNDLVGSNTTTESTLTNKLMLSWNQHWPCIA